MLNRFDQSETAYSTNAGNMDYNKYKNRYKNILPCKPRFITLILIQMIVPLILEYFKLFKE